MMITLTRLKDLCFFVPDTGALHWRERIHPANQAASWNRRNAGRVVGSIGNGGYVSTAIDGKRYQVHRLVWLYCMEKWPDTQIDHINGKRSDNRLENLRLATQRENGKNQGLRSTNRSGVIGVHWSVKKCRWVASITVDGHLRSLGRFVSFSDAVKARSDAERQHGFHYMHGKRPAFGAAA